MAGLIVKLHSKSITLGKVTKLWVRAGWVRSCPGQKQWSWSLFVSGEATKPVLFRDNCWSGALRRHFLHAVEVVTCDDGHRTAHALTCIAGVTADRSRHRRIGKLRPPPGNHFQSDFCKQAILAQLIIRPLQRCIFFKKSDINWLKTKPAKTT